MLERIRTALILIAILALCLFASKSVYPLLGLMLLTSVLSVKEWQSLVPPFAGQKNAPLNQVLWWLLPVVVFFTVFLPAVWPFVWTLSALCVLVFTVWVLQFPAQVGWFKPAVLYPIAVVLMAGISAAIIYLYQLSPWWLLFAMAVVATSDSSAYFVGRKIGKHKMAPAVSPAKSIEGLMGGIVCVAILVGVVGLLKHWQVAQMCGVMLVAAFTVYAGVIGDLFESMLKRQAGVKDSGTILPGHGGILDRIDAMLVALPVFALGLYVLSQMGITVLG